MSQFHKFALIPAKVHKSMIKIKVSFLFINFKNQNIMQTRQKSRLKEMLIFQIGIILLSISIGFQYHFNSKQQKCVYYQQYQLMNTFQITSQLEDIYPDIEGELCSKHTVLLNQIQKAYRKTFPMHPPSHYVISKAIIELAKTHHSTVSMALEQGTVIMYSAGEEGGELHISGNFLNDLVLESSGKPLNSENETAIQISMCKMVELATDDLSLNKINGGFLYIHCQDNVENANMRNSMLIGLFMAIISLNNILEEYNQEDLIDKLKQSEILTGCDIEAYFSCKGNRELLLRRQIRTSINLQKKYKLLFLSLNFINPAFFVKNEGDYYEKIIEKLSNSGDIVDFFTNIEGHLNSLHKSDLLDQINAIKEKLKLKTYILCQGYVIFLVETYRYAELIGKISKFIHELHKSQAQKEDNGDLTKRFSSELNMNSILFSSVPSRALSVLDPSDCMWY